MTALDSRRSASKGAKPSRLPWRATANGMIPNRGLQIVRDIIALLPPACGLQSPDSSMGFAWRVCGSGRGSGDRMGKSHSQAMKEMNGRLKNKVAIVVGSTSGIGAEIARRFGVEGAKVVVSGRRRDKGEAVVHDICANGGEAVFQQVDVLDPDQCTALCQRAQDAYGGLDALIYNTGIFTRSAFDETDAAFWDHMMGVNVRGAFLCCQAAAPLMRKQGGGSMTMMGSVHAFVESPKLVAYGVSKNALQGLVRELAALLRKDRIRVNLVTVGWVLTETEKQIRIQEDGDLSRATNYDEKSPWGLNTEEEMASGCVYLASDEALRVTGTNLNISGGLTLTL